METFVVCRVAQQGKCKRIDCNHYHPHPVYWDETLAVLKDDLPVPCTHPIHCSIVDREVICELIKEN